MNYSISTRIMWMPIYPERGMYRILERPFTNFLSLFSKHVELVGLV